MEKSKCTPAARASKKIILPDPSVRSVMIKYLEKTGEINFDKIFNQRLGYLLFKDFCLNIVQEQVRQIRLPPQPQYNNRYYAGASIQVLRGNKKV